MGLTSANLTNFQQRVDSTLADLFPCTLSVGLATVPASGPGGRAATTYVDGGEAATFSYTFRVTKTAWPAPVPVIGQAIAWLQDGRTILMRIDAIPDRPHDPSHTLICSPRRP